MRTTKDKTNEKEKRKSDKYEALYEAEHWVENNNNRNSSPTNKRANATRGPRPLRADAVKKKKARNTVEPK